MFDIVSIGTITIDQFIPLPQHTVKEQGFFSNETTARFGLGSKLEIDSPFISCGGGAFNTARTFEAQGHSTALISSLGSDLFGSYARDQISQTQIVPFLFTHKKEATGISYIMVAPNGERTIMVHREPLGAIMPAVDVIKARWAYLIPGDLSFRELQEIVARLHQRGIKIACTPSLHMIGYGMQKLKNVLDKLDVVVLNREEAAQLIGAPISQDKKIFKKLDDLIRGIAVMTDGSKGAQVSDGVHLWEAGIFPERHIVDRTGAGDAFGSGFVSGLLERGSKGEKGGLRTEDVAYALRKASANATSVIEHMGSTQGILSQKAFKTGARWKQSPIKESQL